MPAIPMRRGRPNQNDDSSTVNEESAGEPVSNGNTSRSSTVSSANKRARLASSRPDSLVRDSAPPTQESLAVRSGPDRNIHQQEKHQPGSIVRVKLQNFVTYTSADFFPGPSLNMVIGPNGTGKSTLVCAICLGLGWGPQHLGRAKDVSDYVKHGFHEAAIEIELAGRPNNSDGNLIIRRVIKREGNKSQFSINGKQTTWKAVLDLAKSFSIQIDNLCQFLPQDKVCEFAALTPVELLHSTQRAAAPAHMIEWHDTLKQLRNEQKRVQAHQTVDQETLTNLDGRQQILRADVERMKERANIQKRVALLEKSRPFAKYRQARARHSETRKKSKEAQAELKKLEDEVEPTLRAVNRKQAYALQVEKVTKERKRAVERAEAAADHAVEKQKNLEEKISDLRREARAERENDKRRKDDLTKVEDVIKKLERRLAEASVDFDPLVYNEQIREKQRACRELETKAQGMRDAAKTQVREGRETSERIVRAQKELADLDSQAGQQNVKLRDISRETSRAWEWIQANQDKFEHRVYGPPVLECSIRDPKYVDAVESLLQKNDFITFTAQSKNDFRLLGQQLYEVMKLAEINIRTSTVGLTSYRSPVSDEQRQSYGLEGWALDFIQGPEPVLAMLCGECRLHQTGVTLHDISEEQYEALRESPISSWVSGKASYQITRRREYGPGATSTRVRDLRRGRVWTDQPVDIGMKTELQRNIDQWTDEIRELRGHAHAASEELRRLREETESIERERKAIEDEKAVKQRAYNEFKALPTKLSQEQEKLASLQEAGNQVKDRVISLAEKITVRTLEKGQLALDHAQLVVELATAYESLFEVEIMALEAKSDVEALMERNRSVKVMLETRRVEVKQLVRESDEAAHIGRQLLQQCQRILSDEESGEEQREFLATLPDTQTPEELEGEIESERTRLELVHEGNPSAMAEFEHRQQTIDKLRDRIGRVDQKLQELDAAIVEIRAKWEPELDGLVQKISVAFSLSFEKIGCAGQVAVYKDEDFDQWAIQIQVKFRENEPLSILDSHRQSGGERAVSTIFYLMALQSLARAPFRVVDEINQGMDPRNERIVHERMVDIACQEQTPTQSSGSSSNDTESIEPGSGGSQYFLITPKLLHGLKYHRRMKIHCIASGEYMPVTVDDAAGASSAAGGAGGGSGTILDFGKALGRKKALIQGMA